MADEFVEDLIRMKDALEGLNGEFTTIQNIDLGKIKQEIREEFKRELQGRSSYGTGIR